MTKTIPQFTIPVSSRSLFTMTAKILANRGVGGKDVERLENELAVYLGVKHVCSFNGGRTALHVALQALNLNQGDEILVPAYTCPIVFEVVLRLGLKLVFVDVSLETCNIDPELIPEAITAKTKAIIPVHLFGRPCEMNQISEICERTNLHLVEDAAQALGARIGDRKVGTMGDLAVFSFGPGKTITGGSGGALAVNNPELAEPVNRIHAQLPNPSRKEVIHAARNVLSMKIFSGHLYPLVKERVAQSIEEDDRMVIDNCIALLKEGKAPNLTIQLARMPNLSAAVIREQLPKTEQFNERRLANARMLTKLLTQANEQVKPSMSDNEFGNTCTRYVVRVDKTDRDRILSNMQKHKIDAIRPYYYIGDLLKTLSNKKCPNAQELSDSLIALPNHPPLTQSDIQRISACFHQSDCA
jgi:dTDP-4-amino-4,6-dideoxygalactose transaminase